MDPFAKGCSGGAELIVGHNGVVWAHEGSFFKNPKELRNEWEERGIAGQLDRMFMVPNQVGPFSGKYEVVRQSLPQRRPNREGDPLSKIGWREASDRRRSGRGRCLMMFCGGLGRAQTLPDAGIHGRFKGCGVIGGANGFSQSLV